MTYPGDETETGSLGATAWPHGLARLHDFTAIVAGPGMTRHADTAVWIRNLLHHCRCPLLLDADALNVLDGDTTLIAGAKCPVVITPHPGELARLLNRTTDDIQKDREGDVLSGLIGGLLAQGITPFEAACTGVFLHGRAGDNAMWRRSQASLLPSDLIKELPGTFREVAIR